MKPTGAFVGQSLSSTRWSACDVAGRLGTELSLAAKLKAAVRSPTVARRQSLMFGTSTPNRRSRKSRVEVRSKVSDETKPPRLKGETTSAGIRKPRPIGPAVPSAALGRGFTVKYSPAVPAGAVGGGTWSKKPPFSSWVMNSAVLDQTEGLDTSVFRTSAATDSP